jgi:hypothetical protein
VAPAGAHVGRSAAAARARCRPLRAGRAILPPGASAAGGAPPAARRGAAGARARCARRAAAAAAAARRAPPRPAHRCARALPAPRAAGILRWDVLDAAASRVNSIPVLSRYTIRPGQKPASAPGSTLPTQWVACAFGGGQREGCSLFAVSGAGQRLGAAGWDKGVGVVRRSGGGRALPAAQAAQSPPTHPNRPQPPAPRPNAHKLSNKPIVLFRDTNGWCAAGPFGDAAEWREA